MKKRILSVILVLSMVLAWLPVSALAANENGLCVHHTEHDAFCGYVEAVEESSCTHEHTDACYQAVTLEQQENSLNDVGEDFVFDATENDEGDAETDEPELYCHHIHDELCGYADAVEGQPCSYVCEICGAMENDAEQQADANSNLFSATPMAVSASNVWDGTVADSYAGGSGTSSTPYLIATAAQLARIADQVNSGAESGKYYTLTNDIYLNDVSSVDLWDVVPPENEWTPIGNSSTTFSGTFSGNGYTILGLYISTGADYQGLFGKAAGDSAINDLGVEQSYVKGGNYVGAICGSRDSGGFIGNKETNSCHSGATVIGTNYVGGILGRAEGDMIAFNAKNCYNTGKVNGEQYVGGIIGGSISTYISGCYNVGTVTGTTQVGGISGKAISSYCCWNAAQITGTTYVGGILGEASYYGSTSSSISKSFNAGAILGESYVGGILGYSTVHSGLYPSTISDCYNIGPLTGNGNYIGGIAGQGWLCKYFNCYNAGVCSLGNGNDTAAVANYGIRNESGNCYYQAGCCGVDYRNVWSPAVTEISAIDMRESTFVNTLNNGGTAWIQDTGEFNNEYPILSGIDYRLYKEYVVANGIYHFKVSGNRQTNCLAVGDMIEVDVACYLHDSIDSSIQEFTSVVSDSNVVDIISGGWNDAYGQRYSIVARKVGYAAITFNNVETGSVAYLDIFVLEGESGYSFDFIPKMEIESGKTTNFYNYSGLVVDEFAYSEHHAKDTGEIDYYVVTMDIYNKSDLYGAVSAYDAKGNLKGFTIIDKMEPADTNFVGSLKDLYYSLGDLFYLLDNEKYYSGKSISKKTEVEINVPVGGYLSISNNARNSEVVQLANVIGMSVEFGTAVVDFVEKQDALPDDIIDVLAEGDFRKAVINECLKEFTDNYVNNNILKACKSEIVNMTNTANWNYTDFGDWYTAITDRLQELGVDVIGTVENKLFSLTGVASTGTSILKKAIGTGKLIDVLYAFVELGNFTVYAMTFWKSFEYPTGIYIYAPAINSTYLSNGVTAETTTSDPEVVVHAYRVMETTIAGLNTDIFADYKHDIYSITMYKSGVIVQPESQVTVRIPLSNTFENVDTAGIKVYRHNGDGSLTDMHAFIVDGYAVFTTNHFSYYSIVADNDSNTYAITFNPNGGSVSPISMNTGSNGRLDELPVPIRDDYSFNGWFTAPVGGDCITTNTVFSHDSTVFAQWTYSKGPDAPILPTEYTVTFDSQGGSAVSSISVSSGDTITKPADPTRGGCDFGGWYKESSCTNAWNFSTDTVTSSITLYARWTYRSSNSGGGGSSGGGGGFSSGGSSYSISVPSWITGGTVKVSPTSAKKGNTVTIAVTPNTGYGLDKLTATDSKGNELSLADKGNGKYTFVMPASKVTVNASFVAITPANPTHQISFTDVRAGAYYYDAVAWAVEQGITAGTTATTFSPDSPCTRAQIVTFLWRAAGSPVIGVSNPFTDVASGAYYYDAVAWAVANGITAGTSATTFSPNDTCTRGQAVTFLYRAAGSPAASGGSTFTDVASGAYYTNAVQWAVNKGVTAGTSTTTFSPSDNCTRAQIVTFLYRDRVN